MSTRYLEIRPNNVPADNKVQFSGIPVISFSIGSQNALLKLDSIKIAGKLNVWRNPGEDPLVHPAKLPAAGPPVGNEAAECMASEKLGVYGLMSQVVWRNSKSHQVCEHIRSYGRFMSSMLPTISSNADCTTHLSETALVMPSARAFQDSVIRNTSYSSFCCPIPSGITMGGGVEGAPPGHLPLFESGFGGLDCEIHLAPPQEFFFSTSGVATPIASCFYELEDLRIICEVYEPPMDELSKLMSRTSDTFNFNSISTFSSTLESTNAIINFQLGLSRVLAAFVNFVPSSFINNLAQNGYITSFPARANGTLVSIQDVSFQKNGERFPLEYTVDTNVKTDKKVRTVDPQVIKEFASSIMPETQHLRTSISPVNTNRFFTMANGAGATDYDSIPEGGPVYGVGVLYDMLDSDGVSFQSDAFTLSMDTTLDDANPNTAYLFVKAKNTLAFSPQGIQVLS
tara:strand:- start:2437 stop:3804 length:1368 start_codon:yes stop_codon:yes gene_type:complete